MKFLIYHSGALSLTGDVKATAGEQLWSSLNGLLSPEFLVSLRY